MSEIKMKQPVQTDLRPCIRIKDPISALTHFIGFIAAILSLPLLLTKAAVRSDDISTMIGLSIYGLSLIVLYGASSAHHSFILPERGTRALKKIDHICIFYLIAGTYTPITLTILRGALGWTLFGVVWGAAVVGIVLNSVDLEKFRKPSVVCYIAMGWVIVIAIRPLLEKMDALCLWLLVAGGVFYTVGVIFYAIKKVRYFHSVWHIFVLMGSLCHYLSILFAILP